MTSLIATTAKAFDCDLISDSNVPMLFSEQRHFGDERAAGSSVVLFLH
jgi:hypothetical protein